MKKHAITWIDGGREPQQAPDPRFPRGVVIDASGGVGSACTVSLPYPAQRCGYYSIACTVCGLTAMVTTAGRVDDPRAVILRCKDKK